MATKQKKTQPKPKPQAKKAAPKKALPKKAALKKAAPKKAAPKKATPKAAKAKPKKAAPAPKSVKNRAKKAAPPAKPPSKPPSKPSPKPPSKPQAKAPATATPKPSLKPSAAAVPASPPSPIQLSARPSNGQSKSIQQLFVSSPTEASGVRYLTVQDLVELHRAVSVEFGGTQASPGVVESQFGLVNAVARPQVTTLGREAHPTFPEKVAACLFALLHHSPLNWRYRHIPLAS